MNLLENGGGNRSTRQSLCGNRFAENTAQGRLAGLSDAGDGELGHELHSIRNLVRRNASASYVSLDLADGRCISGNHQNSTGSFAQVLVGNGDDGRIVDSRMREQVVLDLLGRNLLTAAVDLVFCAPLDYQMS